MPSGHRSQKSSSPRSLMKIVGRGEKMAVLFLSLRRGHGERSRKEPFFIQLAAASQAAACCEQRSSPGSTNIPAPGLQSRKAEWKYREGRDRLGGAQNCREQNEKRVTLQYRVILGTRDGAGVWTGIQERVGRMGKIVSIFGREGENGALGLGGRPADTVGRAAMGWLTEGRRCRLIKPAASGIIY